MPSFHLKRNSDTAPALNRVREFFRKKRDDVANRDDDVPSPTLRELLQQDRGDLLRDIERILEVHNINKSSENISVPSLQQATANYCSAATQTDVVEEADEPATTSQQSDAATQCQSPNYKSSSTDVDDLVKEEEKIQSPIVEKLPPSPIFRFLPTPSASPPACDIKRPFVFKPPTGSAMEALYFAPQTVPQIFPIRNPVPVPEKNDTKPLPISLASGDRATLTPPVATRSDNRDVIRSEKRIVDEETGVVLVSRVSRILWPTYGKRIAVRLPPQRSDEEDDTDEDMPVPGEYAASPVKRLKTLDKGASDIEQMKEMIETLARGGQWIVLDDGDDGDDEDEVVGKSGSTKLGSFSSGSFKFGT